VRNKDIFFIGFGLSGAASLLFVFLSALSELCGELNSTTLIGDNLDEK
jgi:hypothetical protein